MSYQSSRENYNKAFRLYDKINDAWHELESGQSENVEYDVSRILEYLNIFKKYLTGISTDELRGNISRETLEQVKHNLSLFNEAQYFIERNVKGIKYADDLRPILKKYIERLNLNPSSYKTWAKDEEELARKFGSVLTHIDNVLDYENEIKRIIKGQMSPKIFEKIFNALKSQMKAVPDHFQSLKDFTKQQKSE